MITPPPDPPEPPAVDPAVVRRLAGHLPPAIQAHHVAALVVRETCGIDLELT